MKILIISDSHGDVDIMVDVVEKEQPDMIIHLGDSIKDAEQLQTIYPNMNIIKNLGNADSKSEDDEWVKYIDIYGRKIMLTHGHIFNEIKEEPTNNEGRKKMLMAMYNSDADICLHGHAHEPYINSTQLTPTKRCWIMCPGRIGRNVNYSGTQNPIYCILTITDTESDKLNWQFIEV